MNVDVVSRGRALCIDPAEERRWHAHVAADPRVRLRIEGRVYPLAAVQVTDPHELEGLDAERIVYRLDSRAP